MKNSCSMRPLLFIFLIASVIYSCAPVVEVQYNKEANFDTFETFNFYPTIESGLDQFEEEIVIYTLDSLLQKRNFRIEKSPDFLVNFYVQETYESFDHLGSDYYNTGGTVQEFVLDFVHQEKDELLWRAMIVGKISDGVSDRQLESYYQRLLEELLKRYPPKNR